MPNLPLDSQIEALLFWKGEPVTKRELTRVFGVNMVAVNDALSDLKGKLQGRGVALIEKDTEVAMATAPETSSFIEQFQKDELSKDLGKAAIETLSIILYRGGASRREVEYIRGVNSTSILRTLLIRGLVERTTDVKDERIFMYRPTIELFTFLGLKTIDELPEFTAVRAEFDAFENEQQKQDGEVVADVEDEPEKEGLAE